MHSSSVQWDSLQSSRLFEQWTPSQNNPNEENTDVIFGVEMINDSASVMVTSRTKKSVTANSPINFSKLRRTSFTTTIENLIEGSEYLWNSPPYPIPTINQISTQIFWENGFSLKDIKFQIYDVLGNQIPNPKINFEQTQQFAGLLHWNCEELPKGVYVIRVYISKNSILIPIIKL